MCGRFYVSDEMLNEMKKIAKQIDSKKQKVGEIRPTDKSLILYKDEKGNLSLENNRESVLYGKAYTWGYSFYDKSKPIYNARQETVLEKPMFSKDFAEHRCVVPLSYFYEWNKQKEMFHIKVDKDIPFFLGGIYNQVQEKFTIVTADANREMKAIHHRMPVILRKDEITPWIEQMEVAKEIMKRDFEGLSIKKVEKDCEYEQLKLFL